MLTNTKILLAAAFIVGSAAAASAQGYDPDPETRSFPAYAEAGAIGYYIGQVQGTMAEMAMRNPDWSRMPPLRMIGQPVGLPRGGNPGYQRAKGTQ